MKLKTAIRLQWASLIILIISILLVVLFADGGIVRGDTVDGEIYIGYYDTEDYRAYPSGGVAKYLLGVELGQKLEIYDFHLRPYLGFETLMDNFNSETNTFRPTSIDYIFGIDLDLRFIGEGLHFIAEHSCWHGIDGWRGGEAYNLFKLKYRFGDK